MSDDNKKYTQEDLNSAVAKAMDREKKQRENFISKKEHDKMLITSKQEAIKGYEAELKKASDVKGIYKELGGNDKSFTDFYNLHKEDIRTDSPASLKKDIAKIKTEKEYFFTTEQTNEPQKEPSKNKKEEFYGNTLYKKP